MNAPAPRNLAGLVVLLAASSLAAASVFAQATPGTLPALRLSAAQDHALMMDTLGITTPLRHQAAGGQGAAGVDPTYANYDESKAMAKTPPPPLLVMNDGRPITTPAMWEQHRKELFEIFDREIYGRVPEAAKNLKVTWTVTATSSGMTGGIPTITRQLVGHVDNSFYPAISVNIGASVTTPANATGKVPVIITFGGGGGTGSGVTDDAAVSPTAELIKASMPSLTDAQISDILALNAGGGGARGGGRGVAGGRGGLRGGPAGGRGPAGPVLAGGAALPTIDALKTALNLTDAQVTQITPLLAEVNKAQLDFTAQQTAATALRAAAADKISPLLTDAQKPQLLLALNPPAPARGGGGRGGFGGAGGGAVTGVQQAILHGWGYGSINPASIQADNGAGLTSGIIGLINKGQPRKADDWGALRAWAWGADRLIDFFETDSMVDAKQVAFEGHSRYGKATIVTMVYDQRAANGFVSSSGEGGAHIWRHLVGETVENLANAEEYHWMAGNFVKYAGPLSVNDLPIDNHEFVALVAPRNVFISGGVYLENNGINGVRWSSESWQDTPGTFMATAGASPVWELLGKKGLTNTALNLHYPTTSDIVAQKLPPPNPDGPGGAPVIDGDIAFRQHEGDHTDGPNWDTFFQFASKHFTVPGK